MFETVVCVLLFFIAMDIGSITDALKEINKTLKNNNKTNESS